MLSVGMTALLPAVLYAAHPDTSAKIEKAQASSARAPATPPKPSTVRGPASFTPQMPFSEAIDILRNSATPPLNIIVLWRPLADAGVRPDTPIGIDGVAGCKVGQYLDLLLLSLSAGASAKLGYTTDGGVITIATTDTLAPPKMIARVYDISDLVAPPARYSLPTMGFGMGYGGQMAPFSGYAGSAGSGLSSPASSLSRSIRPNPRTYRGR